MIVFAVVGAGTPPDGHVSGARLLSAGCPAAYEEEPGKKTAVLEPLNPEVVINIMSRL